MKFLMQVKFWAVKRGVAIEVPKIKSNLIALLLTIFFLIFNVSRCYAVAVGEPYGGGTVFCVSQTPDITQCVPEGSGDYGLIMANEDQVNFNAKPNHGVTWSSQGAATEAQSDDNGAINTASIVAALPQDNPSNNAAWLCHNYRDLERHSDWYLPSKNELKKVYLYANAHGLIGRGCAGSRADGVRCLVGGGNYNTYWSSTEYSSRSDFAWGQSFSGGGEGSGSKVGSYFGVRAVRGFNNSTTRQLNSLFSRGDVIAGALVAIDKADEKLLQDTARESTDDRVKKVISAIFDRNRLLAQISAGRDMDGRVAVLRGIMHGEEFHNLTESDYRLIAAIRNMQLEIIRGLRELRLPLPLPDFWLLTSLREIDTNLIKELIARLETDHSIKILNLSNINLSTLLEPICKLLTIRTDFTTINLKNTRLAETDLKRILAALQNNHAVTAINISKNGFTPELQAQFRALEERNIPALLSAAQNPNTPTARLRAIVALPAVNSEILAVVATNPNIDLEGLNAISHHPNVNPTVRDLVRYRTIVAQAGLIAPYLISTEDGKYELHLNNIKISEPLATEIAEKLQHNEIVSIVIYDGHNRTPTAFKGSSLQIIVAALKECKGLTRFIFNTEGMRNGVGVTEFRELLTALCGQQELRQLYLQGHFLGEAVVPEVATILRNNPRLTEVGLGGNNFGPSRAEELVAALIDHRELARLNLGANNLGEAVISSVATILRNNPRLTEVELRGNGFSSLGQLSNEQLVTALRGELEQGGRQLMVFLALAHNPNTGRELLYTIATHPIVNNAVLTEIAGNPNADSGLLLNLAQKPDTARATLQAIVANRNTNQGTLIAVVAHPHADAKLLFSIITANRDINPVVLQAIVANSNADESVLVAVAAHPQVDFNLPLSIAERKEAGIATLLSLVQNPSLKSENLNTILRHPNFNQHINDPRVVAAIAAHPHADANLLLEIAKRADADAATLLAVARNPITNLPGLRAIIHNRNIDPRVLIAIASHPNVDGELLGGVAMDKFADAEVLAAVSRNRNADANALQAAVKGGAYGLSLDADNLLIIASHPNANQETLSEIINKRNIDNRILVALANHTNSDFGILYDIVQHPQVDTNILLAVVRNPNADEVVLDAVVRRENINVEVLATAAANPNAGPDALGAIARNSLTNPNLLNIVLHHRHTDVAILKDIARNRQADIEVLKAAANHPDVTADIINIIATRHDRCNGDLQRTLRSRRQLLLAAHNTTAHGDTNPPPQGNNAGAPPQGSSFHFTTLPPPPYMYNGKG